VELRRILAAGSSHRRPPAAAAPDLGRRGLDHLDRVDLALERAIEVRDEMHPAVLTAPEHDRGGLPLLLDPIGFLQESIHRHIAHSAYVHVDTPNLLLAARSNLRTLARRRLPFRLLSRLRQLGAELVALVRPFVQ